MKTAKTEILSNGSKWAGESPDSIEKLIEVLNAETIEESFFVKYCTNRHSKAKAEYTNFCPISKTDDGKYSHFFGNFENLSHVFRINSNENNVVESLTNAILNNKGWAKYYKKNLVDINGAFVY